MSPKQWIAVGVLGMLQVGDVLTTYAIKSKELNPVSQWLIERGSLGLIKGLLVTIIAFLVWKSPRVSRFVWMTIGIYCMVVAWNLQLLVR